MGQIVSSAAKPKRCNANQLSQVPTPAAGEYILVSSDNSMNAAGQGNFDCYIVGDGTTAASSLAVNKINQDIIDRINDLESVLQKTVKVSDNYDSSIWAYMNATNGSISAQQESTTRELLLYKALKGEKFRVTGSLNAANAVYTFIGTYPGNTAPASGNTGTVIEAYAATSKTVDKEIRFSENGWLIVGMYSSTVKKRWLGNDWQVYKTTNVDFQSQIDEADQEIEDLDGRVGTLENSQGEPVNTRISDDFDNSIWAYINSGTGSIAAQQASDNRSIIYYKVSAGEKYRVTGELISSNSLYTFIAFLSGDTEPAVGDTCTVIETYASTVKTVDKSVTIANDGWLILGFPTSTQRNRHLGADWQVYKKDFVSVPVPELFLPGNITAVVGDTIQVFKKGVFEGIGINSYDVMAVCEKGKDFPRYWEYTPVAEDVGSKTLKFSIQNYARQVLADVIATLTIKRSPVNPSGMKRVAIFGDSLTQAGTWVEEVARRFLSNDSATATMPAGNGLSNIKFIGAMGSGNARYYGVGGWSWKSYATEGSPAFRFQVTGVSTIVKGDKYTNNGFTYEVVENNTTNGTGNILCTTSAATNTPTSSGTLTRSSGTGDAAITFSSVSADESNPLWDSQNEEISFTRYLSNIGESTVDCVIFLLGWNDMGADKKDFTTQEGYIDNLLGALHTQYPSAVVKIVGLQLPSLNGGLAENYGSNGGYADKYGVIRSVRAYNSFLKELCESDTYSSFVEYVDLASQFDSENNMPEATVQVNTRNSKTEFRGTNGVHPATSGYYQIADVVYRNLAKEYC